MNFILELTSKLAIKGATSKGGGLESLNISAPGHGSNTKRKLCELVINGELLSNSIKYLCSFEIWFPYYYPTRPAALAFDHSEHLFS